MQYLKKIFDACGRNELKKKDKPPVYTMYLVPAWPHIVIIKNFF